MATYQVNGSDNFHITEFSFFGENVVEYENKKLFPEIKLSGLNLPDFEVVETPNSASIGYISDVLLEESYIYSEGEILVSDLYLESVEYAAFASKILAEDTLDFTYALNYLPLRAITTIASLEETLTYYPQLSLEIIAGIVETYEFDVSIIELPLLISLVEATINLPLFAISEDIIFLESTLLNAEYELKSLASFTEFYTFETVISEASIYVYMLENVTNSILFVLKSVEVLTEAKYFNVLYAYSAILTTEESNIVFPARSLTEVVILEEIINNVYDKFVVSILPIRSLSEEEADYVDVYNFLENYFTSVAGVNFEVLYNLKNYDLKREGNVILFWAEKVDEDYIGFGNEAFNTYAIHADMYLMGIQTDKLLDNIISEIHKLAGNYSTPLFSFSNENIVWLKLAGEKNYQRKLRGATRYEFIFLVRTYVNMVKNKI